MKKMTTLITLAMLFALAGCNTVRGFGQDIQKAGEVLEDSTKKK